MSRIRLILLDFDGTLVDTRRANARAYVETLREVGYAMTEEEYAARHFGVRCPEFLRSIGIDDPAEIDRLRRRKIELYPRYFDLVALNRPLWEFCQQFRKQGGRVWIVSTGQRANIDNVMRHLHLEAGVDGIISALDAEQTRSGLLPQSDGDRRGDARRNAHLRGFGRRHRSGTPQRSGLFRREALSRRIIFLGKVRPHRSERYPILHHTAAGNSLQYTESQTCGRGGSGSFRPSFSIFIG